MKYVKKFEPLCDCSECKKRQGEINMNLQLFKKTTNNNKTYYVLCHVDENGKRTYITSFFEDRYNKKGLAIVKDKCETL